mmetsp:Transcript_4420/g.6610  ORF Transcript_4420/g.6610 Transcript_4420/m.6610 type:complete len:165 (+) Transcript_4420:32-526(+)
MSGKRKQASPGEQSNSKRRRIDESYDPPSSSHVSHVVQPRNAIVIRNILKDMGIEKYKPRVIDQLMEFFHRHVRDVLEDAYDYQQHAKNKSMGPQDVKLAIQNKLAYAFLDPPPPELITGLANNVNRVPLEEPESEAGIPPPASKFLLTTPNFELKGEPPEEDS